MFYIRNILPKTLAIRFLLIIAIPTIISQALIIFLFYDRHWYNVSYYTSNLIANEINHLINNLNIDHFSKFNKTNDYLNLSYELLHESEMPIKQPKISDELEIFKNILSNKVNHNTIVKLTKQGRIEVLIANDNKVLRIFFSAKLLINPTTYIFVSWLIFLTITLLLVSIIFCNRQIKSILELTDAAERFGKNPNGTNLKYKPSGASEIRRAGIAFLRMKDRIEKQVAKRTQMLAMISHDLRTPITRMKLQLELMDSNDSAALKTDVISMEHMITAYLNFAKGESGEEFQFIAIVQWLAQLIDEKWPAINFLSTDNSTNCNIQIKPHSFERAISNIIDNAIRYSNEIRIRTNLNASNVSIIIEDNGPGIQDDEKQLVIKPFYRADKSRGLSNSSNVGLGLAIAKEIITSHQGDMILRDSKVLGGLEIEIKLPII
ncbi:MAG: ATPase [Rickettsiaceae bacterium]|nr:MAG: ATPase [Rickettsiaceae bacterium]